jgi:hypothetical protein
VGDSRRHRLPQVVLEAERERFPQRQAADPPEQWAHKRLERVRVERAELAESVGDLGDVGLIDRRQDLRIEAVALAELVALLERGADSRCSEGFLLTLRRRGAGVYLQDSRPVEGQRAVQAVELTDVPWHS